MFSTTCFQAAYRTPLIRGLRMEGKVGNGSRESHMEQKLLKMAEAAGATRLARLDWPAEQDREESGFSLGRQVSPVLTVDRLWIRRKHLGWSARAFFSALALCAKSRTTSSASAFSSEISTFPGCLLLLLVLYVFYLV